MKEPNRIDIAKDIIHTTFLGGLTAFSGWQLYRVAKVAAPPPIKIIIHTAETAHVGYELLKSANHTKKDVQQYQEKKLNI